MIGHELSHVYNRDILISSRGGARWPASSRCSRNLAWFIPFGGSDDDDGPASSACCC